MISGGALPARHLRSVSTLVVNHNRWVSASLHLALSGSVTPHMNEFNYLTYDYEFFRIMIVVARSAPRRIQQNPPGRAIDRSVRRDSKDG